MKKNILAVVLLLWSVTALAQEAEIPAKIMQNHNLQSRPANSGIGLKGGLNVASLHGSDKGSLGSTDSHTSFHAGVFAQIGLSEFFSIQPELLYSRKGFELQGDVHRLDYLELPVLAVFNISNHLSVHLGPQISVMLSAKEEGKEVDLEPYHTFDYGPAAGLEGKLGRFRLGGRYVHGLGDILKQDAGGNSLNADIKNGVVQVYLGLSF